MNQPVHRHTALGVESGSTVLFDSLYLPTNHSTAGGCLGLKSEILWICESCPLAPFLQTFRTVQTGNMSLIQENFLQSRTLYSLPTKLFFPHFLLGLNIVKLTSEPKSHSIFFIYIAVLHSFHGMYVFHLP